MLRRSTIVPQPIEQRMRVRTHSNCMHAYITSTFVCASIIMKVWGMLFRWANYCVDLASFNYVFIIFRCSRFSRLHVLFRALAVCRRRPFRRTHTAPAIYRQDLSDANYASLWPKGDRGEHVSCMCASACMSKQDLSLDTFVFLMLTQRVERNVLQQNQCQGIMPWTYALVRPCIVSIICVFCRKYHGKEKSNIRSFTLHAVTWQFRISPWCRRGYNQLLALDSLSWRAILPDRFVRAWIGRYEGAYACACADQRGCWYKENLKKKSISIIFTILMNANVYYHYR